MIHDLFKYQFQARTIYSNINFKQRQRSQFPVFPAVWASHLARPTFEDLSFAQLQLLETCCTMAEKLFD